MQDYMPGILKASGAGAGAGGMLGCERSGMLAGTDETGGAGTGGVGSGAPGAGAADGSGIVGAGIVGADIGGSGKGALMSIGGAGGGGKTWPSAGAVLATGE